MRTVRVGESVALEAQFLDANGDPRDLTTAGGSFTVLAPDGTTSSPAASVTALYTLTATWTPALPGVYHIQPRITTPTDFGMVTPIYVAANL